jgi:hypothetical protein
MSQGGTAAGGRALNHTWRRIGASLVLPLSAPVRLFARVASACGAESCDWGRARRPSQAMQGGCFASNMSVRAIVNERDLHLGGCGALQWHKSSSVVWHTLQTS